MSDRTLQHRIVRDYLFQDVSGEDLSSYQQKEQKRFNDGGELLVCWKNHLWYLFYCFGEKAVVLETGSSEDVRKNSDTVLYEFFGDGFFEIEKIEMDKQCLKIVWKDWTTSDLQIRYIRQRSHESGWSWLQVLNEDFHMKPE